MSGRIRPASGRIRPAHPRVWLTAAILLGFVAQVVWRLWLARDLIAPAAHADEDGYLVAARALAGGPGGGSTENHTFRRLGYPLLISPVYWFVSDAFAVYRGVHLVNALLNSLVFPLAYLSGRRVFGFSRPFALGTAFVAAAMPAVAFYAQFAMPDAVLAPLGLAWLLLVRQWLAAGNDRGRLLGALGSGAVSGLFYAVHVRGAVVVGVQLLAAAAFVLLRRSTLRLSAFAAAVTVAGAGLDPMLKLAIRGSISTWGRSPKQQTLDAFTTGSGLLRMVSGAAGQFWYLGVGTLGLGMIGVLATLAPALNRPERRRRLADRVDGGRWLVGVTALVTTMLIALSSSAALPPDPRINYHAYPRYIHFLFPFWLLAGLAALRTGRVIRLAVAGAVATGFAGAVVYLRLQSAQARAARFEPFDAPEIEVLGWRWTAIGVVRPTIAALALLAVLVMVIRAKGWTGRTTPVLVAGGLLAAYTGAMYLTTERVSRRMVSFQYLPDTPRLVRDVHLGPGDRVAMATQQPHWYFLYNHMREVYWTRLLLFDQRRQSPSPEANVVIAPRHADRSELNWDGSPHGFHLVAEDPAHQWAVWRRD